MATAEPDSLHRTQTRLLEQVRDGQNRRAWSDFHRIYAPMLASFCRRMGLTEADTEDATQEILMTAHNALRERKYDPRKGRFRSWLYGVARNKALVAHRNRRRPSRAQAVETHDGIDLLSGIEDRHVEAERRIWEQEWRYALLAEAMRQVRHTLNEKVFLAFLQYAVECRSAEDVAAELDLSVSSVYVYKQRALEAIRRWVAAYEEEDLPNHLRQEAAPTRAGKGTSPSRARKEAAQHPSPPDPPEPTPP
jgi:RNA polymerase sigma-70 factor (ECF subfamily)